MSRVESMGMEDVDVEQRKIGYGDKFSSRSVWQLWFELNGGCLQPSVDETWATLGYGLNIQCLRVLGEGVIME